jgi:hypothetical protein
VAALAQGMGGNRINRQAGEHHQPVHGHPMAQEQFVQHVIILLLKLP